MRSTCRVPEQEHENSTRKVPDRAPSMLACWDRGLRCRFANKAYERWFEVAADTLNGTAIQDLLEPTLFALDEPLKTAKCTGS